MAVSQDKPDARTAVTQTVADFVSWVTSVFREILVSAGTAVLTAYFLNQEWFPRADRNGADGNGGTTTAAEATTGFPGATEPPPTPPPTGVLQDPTVRFVLLSVVLFVLVLSAILLVENARASER